MLTTADETDPCIEKETEQVDVEARQVDENDQIVGVPDADSGSELPTTLEEEQPVGVR